MKRTSKTNRRPAFGTAIRRGAALAALAVFAAACGDFTVPERFGPDAKPEVGEVEAAGHTAHVAVGDTVEFMVKIENVSPVYPFTTARGFNRPWNVFMPGPLLPGHSYAFTFNANPGHRLSFATMFVQSNDFFYAPSDEGIMLWTDEGRTQGDITDQIMLWDAGTEVNQEPGTGADQPRQGGYVTGAPDPDSTVRIATDDFGNLPEVSDVIRVTLDSLGVNAFRLEIENVSDAMTLMTADSAHHPTPLAPGVFVVHTDSHPLFEEGMPDMGHGLEALAEDGKIDMLLEYARKNAGLTTPLAPGVYASHMDPGALFMAGHDASAGLEALAEDGNPAMLAAEVMDSTNSNVHASGVFAVPSGAEEPGPLFPGHAYEFMVAGTMGDHLSFATMFVQSNDLFYAPDDKGIPLFDDDGKALMGDVTDMVMLWDAGTEFNERPGIGQGQAPRQEMANTGPEESKPVRLLDPYYRYPKVSDVIKVTIMPKMN